MKSKSPSYTLQIVSRPYDLFIGIGHVLACKAARVVVATCCAIISSVAITSAQTVVLYGNIPDPITPIATPVVGADFHPSHSGHRLAAQPFVTGELGIVSSISLPVAKNGSASGVVHFEIWDDLSGDPGTKVASVGDLDLDSWTGADLEYQLVTFDRPVTGLRPNTQYHLLWDNRDATVNGSGNTWFTRMTASSEGTNDAGKLQIPPGGNWVPRANFVANMNYLVMEILEISPSPALNIDIAPAISISWNSQADTTYLIRSSTDLQTWTVAVDAIVGTGERLTHFFARSDTDTFYRVEETP